MPIDPAKLASSIGALDTLSLESGLARTLQQVLRSANALLDADRAGLMLVDHAGALRWASASNQVAEPVAAGQERLAQGPCGSPSPNERPQPSETSAPSLAGVTSRRCASMKASVRR
jgi:hypothetical protein